MSILERFKSKMSTPNKNGCILFLGAVGNRGYGNFWANRKNNAAHRISYKLFVGKIPKRKLVLHKCDIRHCINPKHLFLGTQQDNIDDMCNKKRNSCGIGQKHGMAKLTNRKVINIRKFLSQGMSIHDLCKKYKITRRNMEDIRNGKIWKHLIA